MRKVIAGYEMVSSLLTILLAVFEAGVTLGARHTQVIEWPSVIISALIVLAFMFFNLVGGFNLWRNKNSGYVLSIIAQALQLVSIQTSYFYNMFRAGLWFFVSMGFAKTGVIPGAFYGIGSDTVISFDLQPVQADFIGINLVALLVLGCLVVMYRKKNHEKIN